MEAGAASGRDDRSADSHAAPRRRILGAAHRSAATAERSRRAGACGRRDAASASGCPRSRVQTRSILPDGSRAVSRDSACRRPTLQGAGQLAARCDRPRRRAAQRVVRRVALDRERVDDGERLDHRRQPVRAAGRGRAVRGIRVPGEPGRRARGFSHRTATGGDGGSGAGAGRAGLADARPQRRLRADAAGWRSLAVLPDDFHGLSALRPDPERRSVRTFGANDRSMRAARSAARVANAGSAGSGRRVRGSHLWSRSRGQRAGAVQLLRCPQRWRAGAGVVPSVADGPRGGLPGDVRAGRLVDQRQLHRCALSWRPGILDRLLRDLLRDLVSPPAPPIRRARRAPPRPAARLDARHRAAHRRILGSGDARLAVCLWTGVERAASWAWCTSSPRGWSTGARPSGCGCSSRPTPD